MFEMEVWQYAKDHVTSVAKKNHSIPRAESPKLATGYPLQVLENALSFPPYNHFASVNWLFQLSIPCVKSLCWKSMARLQIFTPHLRCGVKICYSRGMLSVRFGGCFWVPSYPCSYRPLLKPGGTLQKRELESLPKFFNEEVTCSLHFFHIGTFFLLLQLGAC